jgi:hypothetical protein
MVHPVSVAVCRTRIFLEAIRNDLLALTLFKTADSIIATYA